MKGYHYFISYGSPKGIGNCTLMLENEITDWGSIDTLEKAIANENGEDEVTIINWILLNPTEQMTREEIIKIITTYGLQANVSNKEFQLISTFTKTLTEYNDV